MDEKIEVLFKLAGNSNKYQYSLLALTFLIWININVLSVSVGLLEKSPEITYFDQVLNKNVNSTLNSTVCKWESNYTIIKKYEHSIITYFELDCDPFLVGLLGSSMFSGNLVGSFIYQYFVEKFGRKKTIQIFVIPYLLAFTGIFLSPNFILTIIFCFFSEMSSVNIAISSYMICNEVTSSKQRSIFGSLINSAFGVCGILFTLYFKYIGYWRYVLSIAISCNIVFISCFLIFSNESPRFYLVKKDFEKFIESLRKIAKVNNRIKEFDEKIIESDSVYKDAYYFLSLNLKRNEDSQINSQIRKIKNKNYKSKYGIVVDSNKSLEYNQLKDDLLEYEKITKNEELEGIFGIQKDNDNKSTICLKNTKKNPKEFSFVDFFRFPSLRKKFFSLCFIWLTSSGSYYGLSINIKNLAGDVYFNGIFNYFFEIIIYIVAGYLINIKYFGRKKIMIFFYLISIIGFVEYISFKFSDEIINIILFSSRLAVAANYVILFTYTFEIYPSPARARGFGLNSAVSKFTPVIFPILMEILPKIIFYIYLLINSICLILLIVFIPETLGKPLKELIEEQEKENEENLNEKETNVADGRTTL